MSDRRRDYGPQGCMEKTALVMCGVILAGAALFRFGAFIGFHAYGAWLRLRERRHGT